MKKLIALLSVAFVLISACMIYLVISGVSLRSQPIIRASPVGPNLQNIAPALVSRLTAEFQTADLILWGTLPETPEETALRLSIQAEYEMIYTPEKVIWIPDLKTATAEDLLKCPRPCWALVGKNMAHALTPQPEIDQLLGPLNRGTMGLSLVPFQRGGQVPDACVKEKRLDLTCLKALSVHEAERKMKSSQERYFFVRKYNDRDLFVFVQEAPTAQ